MHVSLYILNCFKDTVSAKSWKILFFSLCLLLFFYLFSNYYYISSSAYSVILYMKTYIIEIIILKKVNAIKILEYKNACD